MQRDIYIIAGEVSGDMHAACLMEAMLEDLPDTTFHGAGGPKMSEVGGLEITDWVEDASVMGVVEVLKHYSWFKQRFEEMLAQAQKIKPDALILIDYPGFNLRFAKKIKQKLPSTKIIYYISPQVWAWNKGRIPKMAAMLDLMLCILPFEKKLYESAGLPTEFVGHPLVDELEEKKEDVTRENNLVGLFPGSREREIARLFPMMVETARRIHSHHPEVRFETAAASEKLADQMQGIIDKAKLPDTLEIKLKTGTSHALMQRATCGVVASGTATLEAAAFGLPYCLVYKMAWITYALGKLLVKIKFIGLVNILADEEVIQEFIQAEADPGHIEPALTHFLQNPEVCAKLSQKLTETAALMGEPGAHRRAAAEVVKLLTA